ncbi:deacetoxyvindoline 4-hydroxylase-like [Salvia miltiorrhiza]|uniref:deacetoxyvindoline 4-hydroxylase-like n=1 Tax=Salvia miltiorrhiza TaxID=226208 RepID=UPI0025AC8F69|nr:deacetoxyvindoline 4-hydroxylase-like [Salvia miltiorrhiza]
MDSSSLKNCSQENEADRVHELNAFEATKAGVKGLTDSGVQKVPRMFIRPADELVEERNRSRSPLQAPVIDLGRIGEGEGREKVVSEVRWASKELGIFQIVNHGVAVEVMDAMIDGVRKFHEQDAEAKKQFHTRDAMRKVMYASNVDLYKSRAANWRDTFSVALMGSDSVEPEELPEICRLVYRFLIIHAYSIYSNNSLTKHHNQCETISPLTLHFTGFLKSRVVSYYACFYGTEGDNLFNFMFFVRILTPMNVMNDLQIVTNDEFISPIHRVHANRAGPRISVAGFFTGDAISGTIYGPIKELASKNSGARYKEFTVGEYMSKFLERPIDKSGLDEWRLQDEDNV